jgi:putative SOS response-associated peptidase YedK
MCGRFSLSKKVAELEKRFEAKARADVQAPLFNIAPTHVVPVITQTDRESIQAFNWGLMPGSKELNRGNSVVINARCETVFTKGMFKRLLAGKRCLILADGYIEWKLLGGTKVPYFIRFEDYRLFAFAGIYDEFETIEGEWKHQVCMLTHDAQPDLRGLHERMPLILTDKTEKGWLLDEQSPESVAALSSRSIAGLVHYPIDHRINKNFSNDESLLHRKVYEIAVQGSLFG